MIRILLRGQTGNNLFQYAAARCLARQHDSSLVLDGSWQRNHDWKQAQQLRRLNLAATFERPFPFLSKVCRKLANRHPREFLISDVFRESDSDHTHSPEFHHLGSNSFLSGYFQTPLYFPDLRGTLQQEINYRELPADARSLEIIQELAKPNTVSVHVRRGDFLTYQDTQVCNDGYHDRALTWMREQLHNPVFWIFSDDLTWCRSRFQGPEFRFADARQSQTDPLNDMRLMSHAAHHIMMNSSYSWWATWLHWHPGKLVIMPHAWNTGSCIIPVEQKAEPGWTVIHGSMNGVEPYTIPNYQV